MTSMEMDNNGHGSGSLPNNEERTIKTDNTRKAVPVFFDTETGGFHFDSEILQISMTSGCLKFDSYVEPTKPISYRATEVHKLDVRNHKLCYLGKEVPTKNKRLVLYEILSYLQNFDAACIMISHNGSFDSSRFIRWMRDEKLVDEFRRVISGFVDTLTMFRKTFPALRSQGGHNLDNLVEKFSPEIFDSASAHNAIYDAAVLEKVTLECFTMEDILPECKDFNEVLDKNIRDDYLRPIIQIFQPLMNRGIRKEMIRRMVDAGITYHELITTYQLDGREGTIELLEQRGDDGKPQVIKTKKVLDKILMCLNAIQESENCNSSD